jgi:hypothetical protein
MGTHKPPAAGAVAFAVRPRRVAPRLAAALGLVIAAVGLLLAGCESAGALRASTQAPAAAATQAPGAAAAPTAQPAAKPAADQPPAGGATPPTAAAAAPTPTPARAANTAATPTRAPAAAGATPTAAKPATTPPPATTPAAKPTSGVTATVAPLPVGAGRVEVLNAANTAYRAGNVRAASELYERVLNTPPAAGESAQLRAAVDDTARFRAMLALVAAGDEDAAREQLAALQERDPKGPMTRLAAQFWDQYGMTAQLRAACAQLKPQTASAEPVLAPLRTAGAPLQPDALCTAPGS